MPDRPVLDIFRQTLHMIWLVFTHRSRNYNLQADMLYARHALKGSRNLSHGNFGIDSCQD